MAGLKISSVFIVNLTYMNEHLISSTRLTILSTIQVSPKNQNDFGQNNHKLFSKRKERQTAQKSLRLQWGALVIPLKDPRPLLFSSLLPLYYEFATNCFFGKVLDRINKMNGMEVRT